MAFVFNWLEKGDIEDEHARIKAEDDEQRLRDEALEKQYIRERFNKQRAEESRRNNQEIDNEIETGQKEVEEAVEEHKAYKKTRKDQLEVLSKKCEEDREKIIEELSKEGVDRVQKEKERIAQGKEALLEQSKNLTHDIERVMTEKKRITNDLEKKRAVLAEEEMEKITEHFETMKGLQSAKYEKESKTLNTLSKLSLENAACENAIGKQQSELHFTQMTNNHQLMDALKQDQTSRKSGRQFRAMINQFNDLKNAYDGEESDLITTCDNIQHGKRLKNIPDIDSVTCEITNFSEELHNFKLAGVEDEDKTRKLLKEVWEIVGTLRRDFNKVNAKISNYQDSFTSAGKDQPEIVSADDISLDDDISAIQTNIKNLSGKMLEFQVTDSNRFKQLQNEQFKALAAKQQQIIRQSIEPAFLKNGQASEAEACPKEIEQGSASTSVAHQDPTWNE